MTFQPVVPLGGYTGWRFLTRTLDAQQTAFSESRPVQRATDYFRENIGQITTAADLVADRRLREVALGAFGLSDDIDNVFFVQTVLEEGSIDPGALANRLSDPRYAAFAKAFGFGDGLGPLTGLEGRMQNIADRFEAQRFQIAVGEQNGDLRLALSVADGLAEVLDQNVGAEARWFAMMGNPPLREVFQTALGLPDALASIDIDQQLETFRERAAAQFDTDDLAGFSEPDRQEELIRLFLLRSEVQSNAAVSSGNVALTLLRAAV